ncbi:uncharacterized protein F4812DRAFT_99042 [Daldinia caldariorum]|uniref:uncharacterized protein n=1 Tax=Daldinia caldariorum TaxID=326644 RepID=UPI0020083FE1|nr:uncharacterized protein F4812DRAFT_99042 [Daldinia caldariorum]KAI1466165.1 hypothetical protein F4812DRAFT_99042 [Daldinia caldariorum]
MAETSTSTPGAVPSVSRATWTVSGLQVDVYGLAELPAGASKVSCLWLHHGRLRSKGDMAPVANRILSAYHGKSSPGRGLIAVALDQRNHGSRLVDRRANESWVDGNETHAQDMFGFVTGTVMDTMNLIDMIESHLFGGDAHVTNGGGRRRIDQNLVLGISLGGHSAWQLLFADPRVTAGVIVIGCPDYMSLLKNRARLSQLKGFNAPDYGASFIGSKDFPDALVNACKKYDPKGILFGTEEIAFPTTAEEQRRLTPLLKSRVSGKRFQILSGGADQLVPYDMGEPFIRFFKAAAVDWFKEGNIYVEDNVYPTAGHEYSSEMRNDAERFIIDSVALANI